VIFSEYVSMGIMDVATGIAELSSVIENCPPRRTLLRVTHQRAAGRSGFSISASESEDKSHGATDSPSIRARDR